MIEIADVYVSISAYPLHDIIIHLRRKHSRHSTLDIPILNEVSIYTY